MGLWVLALLAPVAALSISRTAPASLRTHTHTQTHTEFELLFDPAPAPLAFSLSPSLGVLGVQGAEAGPARLLQVLFVPVCVNLGAQRRQAPG